MRESEKLGVLAMAISLLKNTGSWTGRIHIQKYLYFAQELLDVETGYEFVLYQRGPYAFDLDADIRSLRSIGAADILPNPPYGPTYVVTPSGEALADNAPISENLKSKLRLLAGSLGGSKKARDLELLATTLYVMREGHEDDEDISTRLLTLKPHFKEGEARTAIEEVRALRERII